MSSEIQEPREHSLYSRSAEEAILSCILLSDGVLFPTVAADLTPEDFYLPSNRALFRTFGELDAAQSGIDVVTVGQKLMDSKRVHEIGDLGYLMQLTDHRFHVPASSISHYVKILQHKSNYRKLAAITENANARVTETEESPEDFAASVAQQLGEVVTSSKRGGFVSMADAITQSYESIEDIGRRKHGGGMATGLRALDGILGGLRNSEMVVVAGRPSLGKTALAVTIGMNAAKKGKSVALFSLEMSRDAILDRMLCAEARVNSFKLAQGWASAEDRMALLQASLRVKDLKFFIDEEIQRVETMAARAKALQQQHGLDLLIVDYLQLIVGGRHESRVQEVSYISRAVKQMAKSLSIPVIAVAQLNRSPEERGGEPQLSDLRDSGQIEQDADVVMFLWRDGGGKAHPSREEFTPEDNTVNLSVKKQRNGPVGKINLAFLKDYCKFEDQQ